MSLAKQIVIYGVGGAASRLAAILLVPLYTRTLSVADYGQLEVLLALHSLAVLLAGLQSESAAARDYHNAKLSGTTRQLSWGTLAMTGLGSGVLAFLMAAAAMLGLLPAGTAPYLPLLFAMTVPAQLLGIQLVLLRFAASSFLYATLSFLDLALSALFGAVLIVGYHFGITGGLLGLLISKVICVAIAWRPTFGSPFGSQPSRKRLDEMMAYALPTMPSVLLNWLQTNGSRVLLAAFLTLTDVAIVGIAIKISALYSFLVFTFRLAWEPYSFEKLTAREDSPHFYSRALQWYVTIMFSAGVAATVASPLIVWILAPPAYADAARLASFFIVGQFWSGAITILAIGIHGARITSRLTVVYGVGAIMNVLWLLTLAVSIGTVAAALGFMISSIVSALLATHYSDRHFHIGFDRRLIVWCIVASTGFAAVTFGASVQWADRPVLVSGATTVAGLLACGLIAGFGFRAYRIGEMWTDLRRFLRPAGRAS